MSPLPSDSRTRLLDAALAAIRTKGYAATTVDELCAAVGVSKGSFFHHFKGKEDLALAAAQHWNEVTGALFANAPYHRVADARARLLAYIDFRATLAQGELPEITCLLGTLAQETYATHPAIRDACRTGIEGHAMTLVPTIAEAKARHAPRAKWTPQSLALFTQAALQGAFVVAKAAGDAGAAAPLIAHLRAYVQGLLGAEAPPPTPRRRSKR
ncbi:MAG TPA: TetR/AcrR family transcriptional regulator [Rubrivivax sp.]|nr:TetR/AcrR family transcriptional regulator [Rubrivivax sp.]